ncbi:fatty acid hydroxylase superfamily-domain-containing protein [Lipomyces oligophaga]|uniref:fatty acid hydroxylase superfamily-domain-containing protein n=1 Tax=Lipomyces oligophaga TaxID=45792 RepID=UPI0034CD2AE0
MLNFTSADSLYLSTPPPAFELQLRPQLVSFMSDSNLALVLTIVIYWGVSLIFHAIDVYDLLPQYRLHTPSEVTSRNKVTELEVVREVALQQLIQSILGVTVSYFEPPEYTGMESYEIWVLANKFPFVPVPFVEFMYRYGFSVMKIFGAFFIMDTWQYFLHRAMHNYRTLYRLFHSRHHRLYVPYAFGALYNHPVEGLLMDTVGAAISAQAMNLGVRETLIFYTFSTLKTVDDHCGYVLPFDPLQIFFQNNAGYHDIHHQQFGIKTNFSQPFFIVWDKWLGTMYKGPNKQHIGRRDPPKGSTADTTSPEKSVEAKKDE